MGRNVINAESPSLYGQPQVSFRPNDFDAVIWTHGYDIICEKAIRCPCQGNSDSPLPSCQNCHGSGYIYINPYRTKAPDNRAKQRYEVCTMGTGINGNSIYHC